jgi:hypothetical protein
MFTSRTVAKLQPPEINETIRYGKVYYHAESKYPGEDVARVDCSRELHRAYPKMLFQCAHLRAREYTCNGGSLATWVLAKFQRIR